MIGMRTIDASVDQVEEAKQTAVSLIGDTTDNNVLDLFYSEKLEEIESGIRRLNEFSNRAWILSSILLYTLIYDNLTYQQSGLSWGDYVKESRQRLGMDNRDITEQLSAARFFILYHKRLEKAGFSVESANRKLARAELALRLSGNLDDVITHLVNDTWAAFKDWYQSFKSKKKLIQNGNRRDDIGFEGGKFTIGGKEAVIITDDIPEQDRDRIKGYVKAIFSAMADGYEPAIVPVYDKKEAAMLPKLRDRHRQGK